jgi:selenide,water dikinase
MNIVCFPLQTMAISLLREIMVGGLDKMHEAGVLLVGGHSVEDAELKYGLSVTGTVHPGRVVFKNGARAGDRLILTKPLGTGIISTAIKANVAGKKAIARITKSMATLNKKASELMQATGVNAGTDVTGFGFLGHAAEMIEGTDVGMMIDSAKVPLFPEAKGLAEMGMIPGGLHRNREFRQHMVDMGPGVPQYLADILFDPQTSGGLLISVPPRKASRLLAKMHEAGITKAAIVGEVVAEPRGRIIVR